jgi:peptidoglycan-associated lipoprotein
MRSFDLKLAFAALAILALSGCPPTYPKCDSDAQCKDKNEVCVQGQCQECATDAQCKEGFVCDANRCVPKPECTDDSGCGPNAKCRGGKCMAAEPKPGCSANEDCPSGQECVGGTCTAKAAPVASCDFEPILFEFNDAALSSSGQNKLAAVADCLKKQPGKVTLEGHADERGTEEYNLQLSNRRAASVKRYLTDLGVSASSMETVGFGEVRPAQQGASEDAWAANRRVEFRR